MGLRQRRGDVGRPEPGCWRGEWDGMALADTLKKGQELEKQGTWG